MNEHGVFVPYEAEHLAAVLTVPDGDASSLWVLLPGQGAPRGTQYHFAIWTEAARALAERGIASIRMDFRGLGDSTGHLEVLDRVDAMTGQTLAVTRFGMEATGISTVGFAGNCGGGRAGLEAGRRTPGCVGVIVAHMAPRVQASAQTATRRARHRIRSWRPVRRVVQGTFGRRVLKPAAGKVLGEQRGLRASGQEMEPGLRELLTHASVLFISGDDEAKYYERLRPFLDRFVPTLPKELGARLESRLVQVKELGGYRSLAGQTMVLDIIVEAAVRMTCEATTARTAPSGDRA
jgi:hypothetical protein